MAIIINKFSGSGNDFVVIDNRDGEADAYKNSEFVKKVCARGLSVGADGLFFIENSDLAHFKWHFYNADGSEAAMCGNGSRCAARYAFMNDIAPEKMVFETGAGIIEASVEDDDEIKVQLTEPHSAQRNINLSAGGLDFLVSFINTGVPHAVIFSDDVSAINVEDLGRAIRNHGYFAPAGTNVNFVQLKDKGEGLIVRTYERGVEGETLACGTGSVASSLIAIDRGFVKSPVKVTTRGGKILTVYNENGKIYLQGEARFLFSGQLNKEAYNY